MLVGTALAVIGLLWLAASLSVLSEGEAWGYDYRAYADAAARLADNGTLYQPETLDGPYRPGPYGLYMYAPPLGIAIGPLASVGLDTAVVIWFLLHVAGAGRRLCPVAGGALDRAGQLRDRRASAWPCCATSPSATSACSCCCRWRPPGAGSIVPPEPSPRRWPWPSGRCFGLLLIWQFLRRQWRAVAWTIGAGLVLIAVSLPFVGFDGYRDYLTVLRNLSEVTGVDKNLRPGFELVGARRRRDGRQCSLSSWAMCWRSPRSSSACGATATSASWSPPPPRCCSRLCSGITTWPMLVLPAAFLAARGRAWALILPLLTWLPRAGPALRGTRGRVPALPCKRRCTRAGARA